MPDDKSELQRGLEGLGRALTGVTGRLLGPKAIGKDALPEGAAISPEADAAIARAGEGLGRLLNAAGEGLRAHPLDPVRALEAATSHANDPLPAQEGWAPLAVGISSFGDGVAAVAEGALDVVAPRKTGAPKEQGPADGASVPDATASADGGSAAGAPPSAAGTPPGSADAP